MYWNVARKDLPDVNQVKTHALTSKPWKIIIEFNSIHEYQTQTCWHTFEITILAFMICLDSFNLLLSYNVMITCEWYHLMHLAIITAINKPTTPPDFFCISPFDWQQIPKIMNNTKNYINLSGLKRVNFVVCISVSPGLTFKGCVFNCFFTIIIIFIFIAGSTVCVHRCLVCVARQFQSKISYFVFFCALASIKKSARILWNNLLSQVGTSFIHVHMHVSVVCWYNLRVIMIWVNKDH